MSHLLRAGVAKSDITTDDPAMAVHDRLYAKALVLDDGVTRLAILSLDAVAIGGICDIKDDFVPKLRARLQQELGILPHHTLIHATHTHPPFEPRLCEEGPLLERTLEAVRRAAASLTPVRIGVGAGHEASIALNRNIRMKDGKHWTIRHTNPCPPDEQMDHLGPFDPAIGILRIDRADGTPLAVLYNYACHPLVGVPGQKITANYPGFASQTIEQTLGHDCMALFLQGAAGDVTEILWKETRRPMDSGPIGQTLAVSTLKALRDIATADARLKMVSRTVKFPRRTDSQQRIDAKRKEQEALLKQLRFTFLNIKSFVPLYIQYALDASHPLDYAYRYLHDQSLGHHDTADMDDFNRRNIAKYLDNCRIMEKLAKIQDEIATFERHQAINAESGESTVEAEIQAIAIGQCVLVTAPVEVLTQVALNIKAASPFPHTYIVGFSNGYLHYGPPAGDYDKESYEVTECLLGPGWQAIFESTAAELIAQLA